MTYAGPSNEAVQIYGDAANGNLDNRNEVLTVYVREENKTYGSATTTSIGTTTLTYNVQRFPLSEAVDLKADVADTDIDSDSNGTADVAPYSGMSITYIEHANQGDWTGATAYDPNDVVKGSDGRWYITDTGGVSAGDASDLASGSDTDVTWSSFAGERQIGSEWFAFGVVIDGVFASAEEIYEFVQWSLRQTGDIDAGTGNQVGVLAEDLMVFVGDTLRTLRQGDGDGVFIDNFNTNDTNRLEFQDDNYSGTARTFPFRSAGNITFNTNIVNDTDARYWMFFKDAGGNLIDTAGALIVQHHTICGSRIYHYPRHGPELPHDGRSGTELSERGLTIEGHAACPLHLTRARRPRSSLILIPIRPAIPPARFIHAGRNGFGRDRPDGRPPLERWAAMLRVRGKLPLASSSSVTTWAGPFASPMATASI